MTAAALLAEVARSGVRLTVRGDRLHVEARAGIVTPAMRDRLAEAKAELIALLKPTPPKLQMVHFRLKADREDVWHTALGPDSDDLIADLRDRYRDRLDGVRAMSELRARARCVAHSPRTA